jgi:type IV secretory pathway VirB10-like protein
MEKKMSKIETLKNNPKQRNIIMFGIGLGVLIAFAGAYMATKNSVKQEISGGASVVEAPSVKTATGASNSALYNEKVEQSNKLEAEKALEQEKTFVATPVNKGAFNTNSPIDDLDKQIKAESQKEETEKKVEEKPVEEKKVANINQEQPMIQQAPTVFQPQPQIQQPQVVYKYIEKPQKKKFGSEEDRVLIALLSGANQVRGSNAETTFGGLDTSRMAQENQMQAQANQATINQQSTEQPLLDKAGTIYNAVLETAINSDEPSPVLAKIVSGKLKGTRLIGKMVTSGEKVVVEFKTASIPSKEKSLSISAIAIDPNSSRTGLASDVDKHYFLKYGVLLGAAFLGGYADALASQNTTTTQNADGSVLTKTGSLTDKQVTQQALGTVGKELANQTRGQVQNIKPTITVNPGSAIGILLMEDFYGNK